MVLMFCICAASSKFWYSTLKRAILPTKKRPWEMAPHFPAASWHAWMLQSTKYCYPLSPLSPLKPPSPTSDEYNS